MDVRPLWDELEASLIPVLRGFRGRLAELHVSSKPDDTLLSEADLAVQDHIVRLIMDADPTATFVAEEQNTTAPGRRPATTGDLAGRVWIIDPIDGTAEFVQAGRVEFCSVVCLLEAGRPTAALVIAPEIGPGRTPVTVRVMPGGPIEVGAQPREPHHRATGLVSVTRSGGHPRPWDAPLAAAGYRVKTRATSQTLDMVRTCVDLTRDTDPPLPAFELFQRDAQKVWDGAAGMCLALTAGLRVCDLAGRDRTTVDADLTVAEPTFTGTVVGSPGLVARFVDWTG
ncbi:MAG TPA: inositol monophosphatase family protein [Pseudonocardiaceae bacterium]